MKNNVKKICFTAIFTAIIYVFTAYLHFPSHTGYTHVGDAFIYISACLLPTSYAIFAGSFGALLADCLTGFAIWAPASVLIKGFAVLCFSSKGKIITVKNILALLLGTVLCIGGYYLYDAIIFSSFTAALVGIPGYITQSVLSSALFIMLGISLDKINFKKHLGE